MAFKYTISSNSVDSHQGNYHWFAVIVRFKNVKTVDHDKVVASYGQRNLDISLASADLNPVEEAAPIVLSSRIQSFTITHSKSSHIATAAFSCAPGTRLDRLVHAGDWILFWAFDNAEDSQRVMAQVQKIVKNNLPGEGANDFMSGLKFVGRINSPRETQIVNPETGHISTSYQLTAVGFQEFDSAIYYNQSYVAQYQDLTTAFTHQVVDLQSKLDSAIQQVFPQTAKDYIMLWLQTFLGVGPGDETKGYTPDIDAVAKLNDQIQNNLQSSPNDAFLIPRTVALLLGAPINPTERIKYVDILSIFLGVQGGFGAGKTVQRFTPDAATVAAQGFAYQSIGDLIGTFRPNYLQFNDQPVWSLLETYSNRPVNELFTVLRVNGAGRITPTFVCRQSPYSSRKLSDHENVQPVEAFVDLPRWVIDNVMVQGTDLGASDSMRSNFVYLHAMDQIGGTEVGRETVAAVQSPPMADEADIKRNGLRPMIHTVSSDVSAELSVNGWFYNQLLGDQALDQHLKYSGSISLRGIQEPICPGDNVEYANVIYHIESITHNGHIDGSSGRKTFMTTLQVSNGVSVLSELEEDTIYPNDLGVEEKLIGLGKYVRSPTIDTEEDPSVFEGEIQFDEGQARAVSDVESSVSRKLFSDGNA